MIYLRIKDLLAEKEKSMYWLCRKMRMSNQNFQNLIQNRTLSVRFRTLERLCLFLKCRPGELFMIRDDKTEDAVGSAEREGCPNAKTAGQAPKHTQHRPAPEKDSRSKT